MVGCSSTWPQNFEFGRGLWWPLTAIVTVFYQHEETDISLLHCFFHHTACTTCVDCEQQWDSIVSSIANTWHTLPQQGMCLVAVCTCLRFFSHRPSSTIGHNSLVKSTSLFDIHIPPHMVRSWQSSYWGACRRREIIEKGQACKAKQVRDNLLHSWAACGGLPCLFFTSWNLCGLCIKGQSEKQQATKTTSQPRLLCVPLKRHSSRTM
jgi:hypothetical protein